MRNTIVNLFLLASLSSKRTACRMQHNGNKWANKKRTVGKEQVLFLPFCTSLRAHHKVSGAPCCHLALINDLGCTFLVLSWCDHQSASSSQLCSLGWQNPPTVQHVGSQGPLPAKILYCKQCVKAPAKLGTFARKLVSCCECGCLRIMSSLHFLTTVSSFSQQIHFKLQTCTSDSWRFVIKSMLPFLRVVITKAGFAYSDSHVMRAPLRGIGDWAVLRFALMGTLESKACTGSCSRQVNT